MKRLTQKDFIDRCNLKHNNKYDYSLVEYKNISTKINIICPIHGIFVQISKNHKDGQGCPKCFGRNQTKEEFIIKCEKIHNNKYTYNINTIFVLSEQYITPKNTENGLIYYQLSDHHRSGIEPTIIEKKSLFKKLSEIHINKYSYSSDKDYLYATDIIQLVDNLTGDIIKYRVDRHLQGMQPNKVTLNYFKLKGSEIHNNKYDYSLIKELNGNKDKVKIICPEHGEFIQSVSNHINCKDGCPKCSKYNRWNQLDLINEFNKIHFCKYNYSLVDFKACSEKINIICNIHGPFTQNIHKHLIGQGCPSCSSISVGEEYIQRYLDENKIQYIKQHGFDTCRHINKLSFDFYLPEHNICIEFDGLQHFKPVDQFGGIKEFNNCQTRDNCKDKWCIENNVKLIRIKYDQKSNISEILNKELPKLAV